MKKHTSSRARVMAALLVFFALAFLIPALQTGSSVLWSLTIAVPAAMLILLLFPARVFFLDKSSLSSALTLCGLGIMASSGISPDAALSQSLRCVSAVIFLFAGAVMSRSFRPSIPAAVLASLFALGMIAFPLVSGSPVSLQDGGLALLMFALVSFFSLRSCLPGLAFAFVGLLLLLLQQEIIAAAVWGLCTVLLFWVASGRGLWTWIAFGTFCAVFAVYLGIFFHPSGIAFEPFLPRISALPLIVPEPANLSEASSGSLYLLLGSHYGGIVLFCVPLLLSLILLRGASVASHARKSFHAALAFGTVLLLGLRTISVLLMLTDLLPLSAGCFPLLTDYVPQMFADFFLLGILSGISSRNEADLLEDARLSMLAR